MICDYIEAGYTAEHHGRPARAGVAHADWHTTHDTQHAARHAAELPRVVIGPEYVFDATLLPLDLRALQRTVVSIPRPSIAQAASAPATGFSEGAIAPAACPATQPTPPAARKPRSKPQLTTCRLRAGAAPAAFAAAGIELSVGAMLPALTEAEASSLLASGLIQRPPRCPERRQERRAWRDSEDSLARLQLSN